MFQVFFGQHRYPVLAGGADICFQLISRQRGHNNSEDLEFVVSAMSELSFYSARPPRELRELILDIGETSRTFNDCYLPGRSKSDDIRAVREADHLSVVDAC